MKICPTCEEPIPDDQETCGDEICEALRKFVDAAYKTNKADDDEADDEKLEATAA